MEHNDINEKHNDINENFNTLFGDTHILELDVASMKTHIEKLIINAEKKFLLMERIINITNALTIEICTLKQKQKNVYKDIGGTCFFAGLGLFSSFAVITIVMRSLDR